MVSFSLLLSSSKRSLRNCGSYEEGGIFFSISSNQSVAGITGARVGWGEGYSSPPNIIFTQMLLAQARIQAPVFPHNLHAHTRFALDFYALTRSHKSTSTRTHARVFHACSTSAHAHARDFHARARFPLVFHARVHAHTEYYLYGILFGTCARACVRACKRVENASACACKIPQGLNEWTLSVPLQCTYTIKELKLYFYSLHLISDRAVSEGNAVPSLAD